MEFRQAQLDNGFEIVAEVNPSAYSASLGFFVKTGSRHEGPDVAGVSHFLEHMVFKGDGRYSAEDVNRKFDEAGADANAFTTEEQTVFHASFLPEMQDDIVELFGRILRPALRTDDFETERRIILEEIAMYEDQPPFGADDKSRELFFSGHPLANSVLGTRDSVAGLSVDAMRHYLETRYRPDNIVLIGAGRIDFDRLRLGAEEHCGTWNGSGGALDAASRDGRRVRGTRGLHRMVKESASQQYTMLLSDSPCCLDDDRYAAAVLANMIGDDVGSRLYWDLIDTGLADSAGLGACEFFDNGFFLTCLSSEPEYAGEILLRTRRIYDEVVKNGLTPEELDRSKNKILSRMVLANERPGGRLFSFGSEWVVRREYRTLAEELDVVRCLTLDDIHGVLKKYPLTDPLLVTVGPLEQFDLSAFQ